LTALKLNHLHTCIFVLLVTACLTQGQINLKTYNRGPVLNSEFSKQTNSWNWSGNFEWINTRDSSWHWQLSELYRTNLLIPSIGPDKWKDESNFTGYFYYGPSSWYSGIYSKNWVQNDEQFSANNQFASHALGMFTKINHKNYSAAPYAGYQYSKNRTKTDWGWDAGLAADVKNFKLGDYSTSIEAQSNYDFYDERQNYENSFGLSVAARFNQYSGDSLQFFFSQNSKQYYVGDAIEEVQIYQRRWRNSLFYNISRKDFFVMHTELESRDISYFNGRNVFTMRNIMQYSHFDKDLSYSAVLQTSDETQDNFQTITDSRSKQTSMNFELNYNIAAGRRLDFNFAYAKLEYDTPDSSFDDRDEQRFVFTAGYSHRFSPLLLMEWNAYTYLFHQMYIFQEQSSNNSWNRVFKLNPRLKYNYGPVANTLSTQVLANYTVFDFDHLFPQPRSFIFRKYTLSDSLDLHIFKENYFGFHGRLELEDKGSFYKRENSQQVLQSYTSEFLNIFLVNKRIFYLNVSSGYTYYRRREWRWLPKKDLTRNISNSGPFLKILYNNPQRLYFSAYIAYLYLKDSAAVDSKYFTGHIRMNYSL